ncbi:MAG: lytic transglycosylase domain-containing protein [Bdellovibrionales bacterium]|nr:lytic transglycosylase domain-containing protein [Bdellovibrionales bacterium]
MYKEADGAIRFSSKPPPSGVNAKVFTGKKSGFSWYRMGKSRGVPRLFSNEYQAIISNASKTYGVDEHLVRAVIHAESAFNPKAVSPKGALGLMQIMPFHFRRLGIKDAFEPKQNVDGGVRMLRELHDRYKGNVRLMLAAYNAGEEAVARYKGVPPYTETQNYVTKVMSLRKRYAEKKGR